MLFNQIRIGQRVNLKPEDRDGPAVECELIDVADYDDLIILHFNDPLGTSVGGRNYDKIYNFIKPILESTK
jgi:hypothetical protein